MKKAELALYRDLVGEIKSRVRNAQHRAAMSANAEMIRLYWDIGRMIAERKSHANWGTGVIARLAVDLKNDLPGTKGFSERNLQLMVQFFETYSPEVISGLLVAAAVSQRSPAEHPIAQRPVAQLNQMGGIAESQELKSLLEISWAHNLVLIQKLPYLSTRLWYARQVLAEGWSRDTLISQITSRAHERQGVAITNFATTLPAAHADLAQSLLKDPYLFDFLTLEEPFRETELESGLLRHIQKFLLELGRGFAFVGQQYPLVVSEREFFLDLLFYHLQLRCFVVIDLKKGEFEPEFAGKMNFYCSAVDSQLRHQHDAPTIGLILCQTKDRIIAEYSLRDIQKPIGLAGYELTRSLPRELASQLPSIEDLVAELSGETREQANEPDDEP